MCGLALTAPPLNEKTFPERFAVAAGPYNAIMLTAELVEPQPSWTYSLSCLLSSLQKLLT